MCEGLEARGSKPKFAVGEQEGNGQSIDEREAGHERDEDDPPSSYKCSRSKVSHQGEDEREMHSV